MFFLKFIYNVRTRSRHAQTSDIFRYFVKIYNKANTCGCKTQTQKGKIYITLFAGLCYMKPLLEHLLNIRGNRF